MSPLPVAANQHLPPAGSACGQDRASAFEADVVPGQDNAPSHLGEAAGLDGPAVTHYPRLHTLKCPGRQDHHPSFGFNHMAVVHQSFPGPGLDHHALQLVLAVDLKRDGFTSSENHRPLACKDQPAVADLRRQKGDIAPKACSDFSIIDDAGSAALTFKAQGPCGHEGFIADLMCRCEQAAHIYPATRAKENTIAIADDDLACGADAPQNGARLRSQDAVEGGATSVIDDHLCVRAHVEALPVDDSTRTALVDD